MRSSEFWEAIQAIGTWQVARFGEVCDILPLSVPPNQALPIDDDSGNQAGGGLEQGENP